MTAALSTPAEVQNLVSRARMHAAGERDVDPATGTIREDVLAVVEAMEFRPDDATIAAAIALL
jgi:uncharacterized phage protein gp47/JayE